MFLEALIIHYGYLALFIDTVLEGETVLIIAGFLAHPAHGLLSLPIVIGVAFIGSVIGAQIFFYFGYTKGRKFLEAKFGGQGGSGLSTQASRVERLIAKHQDLLMFGFRFLYGFHAIIPFTLGAAKVRPARFTVFNILGGAVWSVAFAALGYLSGNLFGLILRNLERFQRRGFIALILISVIVWVILDIVRRIEKRRKIISQ